MGNSKIGLAVKLGWLVAGIAALALAGCGPSSTPLVSNFAPPTAVPTTLSSAMPTSQNLDEHANVVEVSVSGGPGAYSFSVSVKSPDTGCNSYADWWEVVSEEGDLLYRRVLLHSHVGEQPFTRSGGPVNIQPDDTVIIRAHMSSPGYGGGALHGTVAAGFSPADVLPGFAAGLDTQSPLPTGCAF